MLPPWTARLPAVPAHSPGRCTVPPRELPLSPLSRCGAPPAMAQSEAAAAATADRADTAGVWGSLLVRPPSVPPHPTRCAPERLRHRWWRTRPDRRFLASHRLAIVAKVTGWRSWRKSPAGDRGCSAGCRRAGATKRSGSPRRSSHPLIAGVRAYRRRRRCDRDGATPLYYYYHLRRCFSPLPHHFPGLC